MPYKDPETRKAYQQEASRRHYERNTDKMKARAKIGRKDAAARNTAYVLEQKTGKPCADCDVAYPPCVMQFDHVRGVKVGNISTMARGYGALQPIIDEIAKCELVCANCHAIRTHQRRLVAGAGFEPAASEL